MAEATLWRITRRPYALEKAGAGAREYGGRWNVRGVAVIYTARSIAVAALEKFVHLAGIVPPDLVLVRIDLPDGCSIEAPALADLPKDWDSVPPSPASMEFGTTWARENRSLALYVPSVQVPEEGNAILNPSHREFRAVTMTVVRAFQYDRRLFS